MESDIHMEFLDSINYSFILLRIIKDGYQVESPDFWLDRGNPWEIERIDLNF